MIIVNDKEISGIRYNNLEIIALYKGDRLIWEEISSNFLTSDGLAIQSSDNLIFNANT